MQERLQKILSARGICSRRKAEEYIVQGLVKVNGEVAELGQKADPEKDEITVDGQVLDARKEMVYYVLYKPVGVISTNYESRTSEGKTVRDLLPKKLQGTIFPVGRLDKDSEGLLLFTNDGVLAYRLTHPKFDHEKEYEVTVDQEMKEGQLKKMREGLRILGQKTKKSSVQKISTYKFRIALTEGKNRQIRRMCQKVGLRVTKLKRVRIGTLKDTKMQPGKVRELEEKEKEELLEYVGITS
ncbi:pseudouridine synthase [Candidatus Peregrinibacteria bacterium CG22_combo_CG10-13_8_21_14_all_49_11]|nr:MAG: pseudouridine synthase [Candidatus Peregrinibacteria bacterium CG22_combo_CG10-13_8_21_14_all_49_11]